ESWRGGLRGPPRDPPARSRASSRKRAAAGPSRAHTRGRARRARPGAWPPRGPPARGRGPRRRTRGTPRDAPPAPLGSCPPLPPAPDRARVRVARAPKPRETRAPQRGGEDRRSARCGREALAAPRDPWFGSDQGGTKRCWIRYRGVAGRGELLREQGAGSREQRADSGTAPCSLSSRTLPQSYRTIHRLKRQSSPPAPDRTAQAAGPEPSRDHEREIGLDVAVDGRGADFGGQAGRKIEGDPAVDGAELEAIVPGGATER